jgi:GST-like protein
MKGEKTMIEIIFAPNPLAQALTILLQEYGLEYRHFAPLNETGKDLNRASPLLLDDYQPFEGAGRLWIRHPGAAMIYLATRAGSVQSSSAVQWVMWQTTHQAFRSGEAQHDILAARANRLYNLLNERLRYQQYIANASYSIADMMCYPLAVNWLDQGQPVGEYEHFNRWFRAVGARPAVRRGLEVGGTMPTNAHPLVRAIEIQGTLAFLPGDHTSTLP